METYKIIRDDFSYGADEHTRYEQQGHVIFPRFLTDEALTECRGLIDEMLGKLQPGRATDDIINAHEQEDWIWHLATRPQVLDMIERQVGPNVVFWSSHLLCKPPGSGRHIPWHQDAPYWNVSGRFSGAVWIAFDDVDAANGAMCVIPGWHRKGTLPRRRTTDDAFTEEIDADALPDDVERAKLQYSFQAGGAAIHHTMLPHSSLPNTSDRWRRVLVFRYMAAGGRLAPKQHEDYRTGRPFQREFYLVRGADVANHGLKRSPHERAAETLTVSA